MITFSIYKSTLIYSALYYKRSTTPVGRITLTQRELNNYISLVINNIEEERSIANSFTYRIIENGEPVYDLSLADQKSKDLLKTAQFTYDPNTRTYSTVSSKSALSLKSTYVYPKAISSTMRPEGYEEVLNIEQEPER